MKKFIVDVDFYSVIYRVSAKNKTEAKRKVKAKIKKGLALKNINHIYVDEA